LRKKISNPKQGFVIFCAKNVDEIDGWDQFHQHLYAKLMLAQIPKAQKGSDVISVFFH